MFCRDAGRQNYYFFSYCCSVPQFHPLADLISICECHAIAARQENANLHRTAMKCRLTKSQHLYFYFNSLPLAKKHI